jgi:hypothetical protein
MLLCTVLIWAAYGPWPYPKAFNLHHLICVWYVGLEHRNVALIQRRDRLLRLIRRLA